VPHLPSASEIGQHGAAPALLQRHNAPLCLSPRGKAPGGVFPALPAPSLFGISVQIIEIKRMSGQIKLQFCKISQQHALEETRCTASCSEMIAIND
jgi:hypothetical protein